MIFSKSYLLYTIWFVSFFDVAGACMQVYVRYLKQIDMDWDDDYRLEMIEVEDIEYIDDYRLKKIEVEDIK